ncbi:MAG: glycosyltransferase [Clostridiales Family XIII bacterium]|jgi:glycosyltransferase involved in cell wall biosynthesis|nr:glycosyltransferase [Clostridiales Family XIII bacterium]
MNTSCTQILCDFLAETEALTERTDELPRETAVELYAMFGAAAKMAALNIAVIDPALRVTLCDKQDGILERIIDTGPPVSATGINGVFTPAVQGHRRWGNVELLKDKGLTGYLLAKEYSAQPVMLFCTKPEDYPYAASLPGLTLLYDDASPGDSSPYLDRLREQHAQMDVLILHGMYPETLSYLNRYRKLRPDGKVYCGLDMNSFWMGRIPWGDPAINRFAGQCDVVATSCRSLRDALNRNPYVRFPCRWLPNGFFNADGLPLAAEAERKENIILTVGRIGSAQKNNAELLMGFAKAAQRLDGWRLRLVGPIEPDFHAFIKEYFETFPHLQKRVSFPGAVTNKADLYAEYSRAKLFALTSKLEGAPNVYAEALFHGCMFVTSDIDAADDITDLGRLGRTYKRGDSGALAGALTESAAKSDARAFRKHIPKALAYARRYFDWRRNVKKLMYMLQS